MFSEIFSQKSTVLVYVGSLLKLFNSWPLGACTPSAGWTQEAGYDKGGRSWPWRPSIPSLLVPLPIREKEMTGRINRMNRSRKKPLPNSIYEVYQAGQHHLSPVQKDRLWANRVVALLPHSDRTLRELNSMSSCLSRSVSWHLVGFLPVSKFSPCR